MHVTVDREKCTGIGICESLDPDRFEIDDDGELQLTSTEVSPEQLTEMEEIVRACPTAALRLVSGQ